MAGPIQLDSIESGIDQVICFTRGSAGAGTSIVYPNLPVMFGIRVQLCLQFVTTGGTAVLLPHL